MICEQYCWHLNSTGGISRQRLIIDDFGLRPIRSPQDEDFHDLISQRYENASTLVTSNLDFSEWGDAFPNRLLAAATLDRLRHNAHRVILDGISFRGGQCDKIENSRKEKTLEKRKNRPKTRDFLTKN